MSNLLIFWLSLGIFALIIEMFTGTLYGLSISIGAFVVALIVYMNGTETLTITQALVLAIVSGALSYFFPRWFNKNAEPVYKTGVEAHIGEIFVLQKNGKEYRVMIDGVGFLIDPNCVEKDFEDGKRVILNGVKNGLLEVTLMS